MTHHCRSVCQLFTAVLVAALAVGGCARANQTQGGGVETGLCSGWQRVDLLDEPSVSDDEAMADYVEALQRTIDAIDTGAPIDGDPVPPRVLAALEGIESDLERLASAIETDGGRAAQAQLVSGDFDDRYELVDSEVRASC